MFHHCRFSRHRHSLLSSLTVQNVWRPGGIIKHISYLGHTDKEGMTTENGLANGPISRGQEPGDLIAVVGQLHAHRMATHYSTVPLTTNPIVQVLSTRTELYFLQYITRVSCRSCIIAITRSSPYSRE